MKAKYALFLLILSGCAMPQSTTRVYSYRTGTGDYVYTVMKQPTTNQP